MSERPVITEAEKRHAMDVAMKHFRTGMDTLPKHLIPDYMTSMATLCISIIHGTLGREFADGYLRGAVESLDEPSEVWIEQTRN